MKVVFSPLHVDLSEDPLMMEKQAKVVYRNPCSCGKTYTGETVRQGESLCGWPGQDCQGAASEGGHPHPTESPIDPLTGIGVWSCLDAGWLHWRTQEANTTKDLWHQLTVQVTAPDEMQGYIMTRGHTNFIFALKKARVSGQNVSKTNLFEHAGVREPYLFHDCASGEAITSSIILYVRGRVLDQLYIIKVKSIRKCMFPLPLCAPAYVSKLNMHTRSSVTTGMSTYLYHGFCYSVFLNKAP